MACGEEYIRDNDLTNIKVEVLHRSISTPIVIEKDEDYYTTLQSKLLDLRKLLVDYKAEKTIVKACENFRKTLMLVLREYYKGNIAASQIKMINQIKEICNDDSKASCDINGCQIFDGDTEDIPFFRARLDADEDGFESKDMGAIPFSKRTKTKTERFSMPGLPCLYLGNTSYVCWLEMGKPSDDRFNVSPVLLDRTQRVFDLTVSPNYLFDRDRDNKLVLSDEVSVGLVKRVMLSICSSFRIKEDDRHFKSEYIIPQLIMLACQKKGLDGVAYISSKVSNSGMFGFCAVNLALYAKYPNNTFRVNVDRSEIEEHIKIDDAFNYAMYKQFTQNEPLRKSPLWIDRCRWITNIDIHGHQFSYKETEFYDFDKFLFYRWEDKNSIVTP